MHRFGALISGIFAVTTLSLSNSATNNFLSSGQLTEGRWIDIRLALAEMLSAAEVAENSSIELRQMRPKILERLQQHVSALDIARQHPLMKDYAPSRFESDTSALLSDLEFESLVANYAIRMEINRSNVQGLLGEQSAVMGMIEEAQ